MSATMDLTSLFDQSTFEESTLDALTQQVFGSFKGLEQFRLSVDAAERSAQVDGSNIKETAFKLGMANWLLGRPGRALEWFGKAKSSKERHLHAGLCHREAGAWAPAMSEFEKAAAAGADELRCTCERAETLLLSGDPAAAKKLLDGVASRGAERACYHLATGRCQDRLGEAEAAVQSFDRAVALEPNNARALFHLAYALDLHGAEEEALELYERCVEILPVHVNALINLAVLLEDRGDNAAAEQCLRRVLAVHPNHPRASLFLKDVLAANQQLIDEEWERATEERSAVLDTPISEYELSVRARNCLKKLNIHTLGDILRISETELLAYKNFGETSLSEVKAMLLQKGLKLGQNAGGHRAAPRKPAVTGNPDLMNKPVSELELSVRSRKCLQRLGIASVGELASRSEQELLSIRNFGQTSLSEIKRRLGELGLGLRQST